MISLPQNKHKQFKTTYVLEISFKIKSTDTNSVSRTEIELDLSLSTEILANNVS